MYDAVTKGLAPSAQFFEPPRYFEQDPTHRTTTSIMYLERAQFTSLHLFEEEHVMNQRANAADVLDLVHGEQMYSRCCRSETAVQVQYSKCDRGRTTRVCRWPQAVRQRRRHTNHCLCAMLNRRSKLACPRNPATHTWTHALALRVARVPSAISYHTRAMKRTLDLRLLALTRRVQKWVCIASLAACPFRKGDDQDTPSK